MSTFPLPKITLNERVVIMTGGDRGLGLAMAKALAKCGAKLVIASIDEKICDNAVGELENYVGKECGLSVKTDITDYNI